MDILLDNGQDMDTQEKILETVLKFNIFISFID